MVSHEFLQGFLFCAMITLPLWAILDGIEAIVKHFKSNKEDDE